MLLGTGPYFIIKDLPSVLILMLTNFQMICSVVLINTCTTYVYVHAWVDYIVCF